MVSEEKVRSNSLIYYLSFAGFFAIFSTTISKSPVLPLFTSALNANNTVIGLIAAFSPLAGILVSFPVGLLSDRLGYRRLLYFSALVFVSAPLLYLLINNPWYLIPLRFFHGLATAILGPVVTALIFANYPDTKAEKNGLYSSATLLGRTLAPLLGGYLISSFLFYGGLFSYKLVYMAAFLLALPAAFLLFFLRAKDEPRRLNTLSLSDFGNGLRNFVADRRVLATALMQMSTYFAYGALETYLPLYLKLKGYSAYTTGLIFSLQILIIALSQPLFGRLSDRKGRRLQIVAGILISGFAMVLLLKAESELSFIAVGLLFGLGMSFSTAATSAYVADIVKREELGASVGALHSVMDIGQTFGPVLTGLMISAAGFAYGFSLSFGLAVLVSLVFVSVAFKKAKT